jgi:hypothetical protein
LIADFYPQGVSKTADAIAACNKKRFPTLDVLAHSVAVIHLNKEEIALVYYPSVSPDRLLETLQINLPTNLRHVEYVVYRGVAFFADEATGKTLLTAISEKVQPSIAAILEDPPADRPALQKIR